LQRLKARYAKLLSFEKNAVDEPINTIEKNFLNENEKWQREFENAMDDDFNTANAITAVFMLSKTIEADFNAAKVINEGKFSKEFIVCLQKLLKKPCDILGINLEENGEELDTEIETIIAARNEARKSKNFAEADRIRDELLSMGIILEDTADGVRWRRA
jgi:cysteinyl-tRNA synthetase